MTADPITMRPARETPESPWPPSPSPSGLLAEIPAQAMANARLAAVLVQALKDAGVKDVVASPGGRNIPLLAAVEAADGLRITSVVDERQAGFVALGLACATNRPVATMATSGSASAHYLPAVVEADANGIPLVIVSADRPAERHGFGAPQCMPQNELFGPYVADAVCLEACTPQSDTPISAATSTPAAALRWADAFVSKVVELGVQEGRPVHINARFREPLWHPEAASLAVDSMGSLAPRPQTTAAPIVAPDQARRIADSLLWCRRGLIVVGPRVGPLRDDSAILALARRLRWPVLADTASGLRASASASADSDTDGGASVPDVLVTTHEALLGCSSFASEAPDMVLQFGREPIARRVWEWLRDLPDGTERMHVESKGRWFDAHIRATELVTADAASFVAAVGPLLGRPSRREPSWLTRWQRAEALAAQTLSELDNSGWSEATVAATTVQALGADDALLLGNSMPIRDVDLFSTGSPTAVFANRGVNGIDGHIATAIGIAQGTGRRCLAIIGDLTALHDIGALAAAVQLQAGITLVVVDNRGGGIFEHLPVAQCADRKWFETRVATTHETDIAAVGRAFGLIVHEVVNKPSLASAIASTCGETGTVGPVMVVARVDRNASTDNRRSAIQAVVARLDGFGDEGVA